MILIVLRCSRCEITSATGEEILIAISVMIKEECGVDIIKRKLFEIFYGLLLKSVMFLEI